MSYKGRYVEKNEYKCSFMNEVEVEREECQDLNKKDRTLTNKYSALKVGRVVMGLQQIVQFA